MRYRRIVINGKFLSQSITGVQRYAREMLAELDKLLDGSVEVILAADSGARDIPEYRNIRVQRVGKLHGSLWEQLSLPRYVRRNKALCVNLCNIAPILTPHVVVVHDVSFRVNKQFFSRKFALWYGFVFALIIRRIKRVVTVSQFSRSEISREYRLNAEDIAVTYNGWQHFGRIEQDEDALRKYGLQRGKYCFAMSSMAKNKNFRWIALAAKNNPEMEFAVSGAVNTKVFGDAFDFEVPENLRFLGYVSDAQAKALMGGCRAFLFPTYYEGFGIPPLEAMSAGAECIVSDASCMREIYGDSVHYIDPDDAAVDIEEILRGQVTPAEQTLRKYSWQSSAQRLHQAIMSLLNK